MLVLMVRVIDRAVTYVARIAPKLPILTMYPPVTARTAGPAALLRPQLRNPGPPGKAPAAEKKTAMYFKSGLSTVLSIVKPMIHRIGKVAR